MLREAGRRPSLPGVRPLRPALSEAGAPAPRPPGSRLRRPAALPDTTWRLRGDFTLRKPKVGISRSPRRRLLKDRM